MKRLSLISLSLFLFLLTPHLSKPLQAQNSIQQELDGRKMSLADAQRMLRAVGVNPNNPDELARLARQQGVPEDQIQQWLVELRQLQNADAATVGSSEVVNLTGSSITSETVVVDDIENLDDKPKTTKIVEDEKKGKPLEYFGYSIFNSATDAFKPSSVGPVDEGYVVGPEDQLRISVWGDSEFQYELQVDLEGRIFIPQIGQIMVAGQRLTELREYLKKRLSQRYSGLLSEPAKIFMDVNITRLRPIKIFVLGEVTNPGGYTFNHNAKIFNILYGVGGPTINGSLRDVRIIRDGKVVATIDFYDLLLRGKDPTNIALLNNDRIFIPPRKSIVAIRGEVRRSAIFEMKPGETFTDLIEFSGGLMPTAYYERFQITRILKPEERKDPSIARKVIDLNLSKELRSDKLEIRDGDRVRIFAISDVLENKVTINGAVFQPGRYELSDKLITVKDLIQKADGLTGDAWLNKADLIRTFPDSSQTFISLDLQKLLQDTSEENIKLQSRDRIRIYSIREIEDTYNVSIGGHVKDSKSIRWRDSLRVYDMLLKAGGLFDPEYRKTVFMERADLIRRDIVNRTATTIPFNLDQALNEEGFGNELVIPGDRIVIYQNTVQKITDKQVIISGSVKSPDSYEYTENMTLEDLIIKANGFTRDVFFSEVEITRNIKSDVSGRKSEKFVHKLTPDGVDDYAFYKVDLFWPILDKASKIELEDGDRVYFRKNPTYIPQRTVSIRGEVKFPGSYTLLHENETLSSLINRAGGVTSEAFPKGGRMLRDSLRIVVKLDEIINGNKKVDIILNPGDEITIPLQPNMVEVQGYIALNGLFNYESEKRIKYYIEQAGGMREDADKYVLLIYPNGATFKIQRKGWFWRENPKVEEGSTIVVFKEPVKDEDIKQTIKEGLVETTQILMSALTLIILIDRAFISK